MDHFNSSGLGYDKNEVNEFVDYVIKKTEENVKTIKNQYEEIKSLKEELEKYKKIESSMNYINEEKRLLAEKEANMIISEAKDNANKIVNDALIKSQKLNMEREVLESNIKLLKKKIRNNLLEQLNLVEDIETL